MITISSGEAYLYMTKCNHNDSKNTFLHCFLLLGTHFHLYYPFVQMRTLRNTRLSGTLAITRTFGSSFGTGTVLSLPGPAPQEALVRAVAISTSLWLLSPLPYPGLGDTAKATFVCTLSAHVTLLEENGDMGKWYFLTRGQKHGCVDGGELPTRASSWPIKSNKSFPLTSEHLQRFLLQFPRDDSEDAPPSGSDQKDCHLFPHVPPHPNSMGPPCLSENWTQTSYHSPG